MEYLLFQHDEKTGEVLRNELGQKILRDEFYQDGLNCNPDTFDIECRMTNEVFKKNRRRNELKSHHYIISFDPADARKVKITNLQQMANTLIYIQEHGYDTREDLSAVTAKAKEDLNKARNNLNELTAELKTLNAQIHYTGQYFSSKSIYAEFIKSRKKKVFRREHGSELQAYEQARDWLKNFYPDGKMLSMKTLKSQKQELQDKIIYQENKLKELKERCRELETVSYNVDAILDRNAMETEKAPVHSASHHKSPKERKEESL